jgi:6-phospho-beta-glucosidase
MLERYKKQLQDSNTRADIVLQLEQELLSKYQEETYQDIEMDRGGTYYSDVACRVIASIENDKRDYHVLIVPNSRVTTDLPQECAIEVTCRVTKHGPVPVYIGTLPLPIKGLIQQVKTYEELLVDAMFERDLEKAKFALFNHPLTTSIKHASEAFDELCKIHKEYLSYYEDEL